jgi:Domain of Unknown Function (DUF1080)
MEFMKMKILTLFITLFTIQAMAQEIILFEQDSPINLPLLFDEVRSHRSDPPGFYVDDENLVTYAGDGDWGLLYTKEKFKNFILDLKIRVPEAPFQYVNSGIFFRCKDPKNMDDPLIPPRVRELALTRTPAFIAEWSSYEIQLLAGVIVGDPPNKRNGAFYDIPVGQLENQQGLREYKFNAGEVYEIRLKVVDQNFEVFMKWGGQENYVLVSFMKNSNPLRSFEAGHVGIQSYYSNGQDVKAFKFEKMAITPLP